MLSYDESFLVLDTFALSLPKEIFNNLNGGILLLNETITDEKDNLLILGQYHIDPNGLGRYITIHYGSILECFGHLPPDKFKKELENVLCHELIHHLENLAGDRSLEIQDALDILNYKRTNL